MLSAILDQKQMQKMRDINQQIDSNAKKVNKKKEKCWTQMMV